MFLSLFWLLSYIQIPLSDEVLTSTFRRAAQETGTLSRLVRPTAVAATEASGMAARGALGKLPPPPETVVSQASAGTESCGKRFVGCLKPILGGCAGAAAWSAYSTTPSPGRRVHDSAFDTHRLTWTEAIESARASRAADGISVNEWLTNKVVPKREAFLSMMRKVFTEMNLRNYSPVTDVTVPPGEKIWNSPEISSKYCFDKTAAVDPANTVVLPVVNKYNREDELSFITGVSPGEFKNRQVEILRKMGQEDPEHFLEVITAFSSENRDKHPLMLLTPRMDNTVDASEWLAKGGSLEWRSPPLPGDGVQAYGHTVVNSKEAAYQLGKKGLLTEEKARVVLKQMAEIVGIMNSKGYIMGEVHLEDFVVTEQPSGKLQVRLKQAPKIKLKSEEEGRVALSRELLGELQKFGVDISKLNTAVTPDQSDMLWVMLTHMKLLLNENHFDSKKMKETDFYAALSRPTADVFNQVVRYGEASSCDQLLKHHYFSESAATMPIFDWKRSVHLEEKEGWLEYMTDLRGWAAMATGSYKQYKKDKTFRKEHEDFEKRRKKPGRVQQLKEDPLAELNSMFFVKAGGEQIIPAASSTMFDIDHAANEHEHCSSSGIIHAWLKGFDTPISLMRKEKPVNTKGRSAQDVVQTKEVYEVLSAGSGLGSRSRFFPRLFMAARNDEEEAVEPKTIYVVERMNNPVFLDSFIKDLSKGADVARDESFASPELYEKQKKGTLTLPDFGVLKEQKVQGICKDLVSALDEADRKGVAFKQLPPSSVLLTNTGSANLEAEIFDETAKFDTNTKCFMPSAVRARFLAEGREVPLQGEMRSEKEWAWVDLSLTLRNLLTADKALGREGGIIKGKKASAQDKYLLPETVSFLTALEAGRITSKAEAEKFNYFSLPDHDDRFSTVDRARLKTLKATKLSNVPLSHRTFSQTLGCWTSGWGLSAKNILEAKREWTPGRSAMPSKPKPVSMKEERAAQSKVDKARDKALQELETLRGKELRAVAQRASKAPPLSTSPSQQSSSVKGIGNSPPAAAPTTSGKKKGQDVGLDKPDDILKSRPQ